MKTKFNPKDVPDWCKWIAVEQSGVCFAFSKEPFVSHIFAFLGAAPFSKGKFLYKGAPPKNWKEELYTWE